MRKLRRENDIGSAKWVRVVAARCRVAMIIFICAATPPARLGTNLSIPIGAPHSSGYRNHYLALNQQSVVDWVEFNLYRAEGDRHCSTYFISRPTLFTQLWA